MRSPFPETKSSLWTLRFVFLSMMLLTCVTSPVSALVSSHDDSLWRYVIIPAGIWMGFSHTLLFRRGHWNFLVVAMNAAAMVCAAGPMHDDGGTALSGFAYCSVFLFMLYGTTRRAVGSLIIWILGIAIAYLTIHEPAQFAVMLPGLLLVPVMQRIILAGLLDGEVLMQRSVASAQVSNELLAAHTRTRIVEVLINGTYSVLSDLRIESVNFLPSTDREYHSHDAPATASFDIIGERVVHGRLELIAARPLRNQAISAMKVLAAQASMAIDRFESSERLMTLFANSADILVVLEEDGQVSSLSPAYEVITGRSPEFALGKHVRTLLHPDDAGRLLVAMASRDASPVTLSLRWRCADNAWRLTEAKLASLAPSSQTARWALNARDISERAALEVELRHAQKLEAVGRLASGVAHEINTPIQFAGNNLHFLKTAFADFQRLLTAYRDAIADGKHIEDLRSLEDELDVEFLEEQIPVAVEQGLEGTERVARIVKAMKTFGHPDGAEQTAVDINELIASTVTVARNEWKYVSTVETQLNPLPPVLCFPGDVNQVLLNLIVNAAHAIADKGATEADLGTITIRTWVDGSDVAIAVSDTGVGIANDVKARIYDPFFTTKEVGRGTGQGLALAQSLVVDRHGGTLSLDTELGVGTTFTIRLPLAGLRTSNPSAVIG